MKKQEYLHLHVLLSEIKDDYEQKAGYDLEIDKYDELGVRPTAIHKSKDDHKSAIFALAEGLIDEMSNPESMLDPDEESVQKDSTYGD